MQVMDDTADPIVPGGATFCAQLQSPNGKIEFVIDDQDIFWLDFIPAHQFTDSFTAQVHIGERLGEYYFLKSDVPACQDGSGSSFVPLPAQLCRQFINTRKPMLCRVRSYAMPGFPR